MIRMITFTVITQHAHDHAQHVAHIPAIQARTQWLGGENLRLGDLFAPGLVYRQNDKAPFSEVLECALGVFPC